MGAFLLAAGTAGKRHALPNSRMMLHQPSGGSRGVAADIEIQAQVLLMRERLNKLIAEHTERDEATVAKDTDRDFWMSPDAALEYGLSTRCKRPEANLQKSRLIDLKQRLAIRIGYQSTFIRQRKDHR